MRDKRRDGKGPRSPELSTISLSAPSSLVTRHASQLELVEPSERYRDSFTRMVKELEEEGDEDLDLYLAALGDFAQYVRTIRDHAQGLSLPAGWVPSRTYWLVGAHRAVFGAVRIRTALSGEFLSLFGGHIGYHVVPSQRRKGCGTLMLGLALQKAGELGLKKVLLTCAVGNRASRGVIERNGGIFESEVIDERGETLRRYWAETV